MGFLQWVSCRLPSEASRSSLATRKSRNTPRDTLRRSRFLSTPGKSACTRNCGKKIPAWQGIPPPECPPPLPARFFALRPIASRRASFPAADYSASSEKPAAPDSIQKSLSPPSRKCSAANLSSPPHLSSACPFCSQRSPRPCAQRIDLVNASVHDHVVFQRQLEGLFLLQHFRRLPPSSPHETRAVVPARLSCIPLPGIRLRNPSNVHSVSKIRCTSSNGNFMPFSKLVHQIA